MSNPDFLPPDQGIQRPDQEIIEERDQAQDQQAPRDQRADQQRPLVDQAPSDQAEVDQEREADEDGDGRPASVDCNDQNPDIFPQAFEFCDGLDNDCDEQIDEVYPRVGSACSAGRGGCAVDGRWQCSADLRGVSCDAEPSAPEEEICDQLDNDCDGQADEEISCICEPVEERCDGLDNDCDGNSDEGVLNSCGRCGEVPEERCNLFDDDCDGEVDEGLRNRCGECGAPPVERCDGDDNDCDGRVDEGVLNGCGLCGQLPPEQCDLSDNDCDGEIDEGFDRPCTPNCVPEEEQCNGGDDDCDGLVDERLAEPCVVLIGASPFGRANDHLGSALANAGDLNSDGIPDIYVGAPGLNPSQVDEGEASTPGRVYAVDGQNGQLLWQISGEGGFGISLSAGDWNGDGSRDLAVGAPLANNLSGQQGSIFIYSADGTPIRSINPSERSGVGYALRTIRIPEGEALAFGVPLRGWNRNDAAGWLVILRFDPVDPSEFTTQRRLFGDAANQRFAEQFHPIRDLDGDEADELVITRRLNSGERESILYLSATQRFDGTLRADRNGNGSFAESVIDGLFEGREAGPHYAFGAPQTRIDGSQRGYLMMVNGDGDIYQSFLFQEAGGRQGHALARCPRPNYDALFVGGAQSRRLFLVDLVEETERTVYQGPEGVGYQLSLSRTQSADGSWRLFVGSPQEANGRGRVLIFSVR